MKITVRAIPRSSQRKIVNRGSLDKVYIHESATDGKANEAIKKLLAETFNVPKSRVTIIKGERARTKTVSISDKIRKKGL